jgi:hypothetical protein
LAKVGIGQGGYWQWPVKRFAAVTFRSFMTCHVSVANVEAVVANRFVTRLKLVAVKSFNIADLLFMTAF